MVRNSRQYFQFLKLAKLTKEQVSSQVEHVDWKNGVLQDWIVCWILRFHLPATDSQIRYTEQANEFGKMADGEFATCCHRLSTTCVSPNLTTSSI